tara:strand:- start:1608 stop:1955 length:348 start_codon:yes stop_codon:yes gene_type:complete
MKKRKLLNLKENIVDVVLRSLKWFIVGYFLLAHTGCTTAPNGAINKVTPQIQEDGYRVFDKLRQINHVYSKPVVLNHKEKMTQYCRQHKKWEIIMAFWEPTDDSYYYLVNEHRKW